MLDIQYKEAQAKKKGKSNNRDLFSRQDSLMIDYVSQSCENPVNRSKFTYFLTLYELKVSS